MLALTGPRPWLGSAQRPGCGAQVWCTAVLGPRRVGGPPAWPWWTWSTLPLPFLAHSAPGAARVSPLLLFPCPLLPQRRWTKRHSGVRLPHAAPPSFHSRRCTASLLYRTTRVVLFFIFLMPAATQSDPRRGGSRRAAVPRPRCSPALSSSYLRARGVSWGMAKVPQGIRGPYVARSGRNGACPKSARVRGVHGRERAGLGACDAPNGAHEWRSAQAVTRQVRRV